MNWLHVFRTQPGFCLYRWKMCICISEHAVDAYLGIKWEDNLLFPSQARAQVPSWKILLKWNVSIFPKSLTLNMKNVFHLQFYSYAMAYPSLEMKVFAFHLSCVSLGRYSPTMKRKASEGCGRLRLLRSYHDHDHDVTKDREVKKSLPLDSSESWLKWLTLLRNMGSESRMAWYSLLPPNA
jgi:hypothetical protein